MDELEDDLLVCNDSDFDDEEEFDKVKSNDIIQLKNSHTKTMSFRDFHEILKNQGNSSFYDFIFEKINEKDEIYDMINSQLSTKSKDITYSDSSMDNFLEKIIDLFHKINTLLYQKINTELFDLDIEKYFIYEMSFFGMIYKNYYDKNKIVNLIKNSTYYFKLNNILLMNEYFTNNLDIIEEKVSFKLIDLYKIRIRKFFLLK